MKTTFYTVLINFLFLLSEPYYLGEWKINSKSGDCTIEISEKKLDWKLDKVVWFSTEYNSNHLNDSTYRIVCQEPPIDLKIKRLSENQSLICVYKR